MQSLFHPEGNRQIVERIEKLTPITLSEWGVMTVSQMLEHCQQPIKISFGTLQLKPNLLSVLFGKMAKKKMANQKQFGRSLPTIKEFRIKHEPDFNQAKTTLIGMVQRFSDEGHDAIAVTKHPFFGEMTMEEWDILQWKHLDHHLRQFGA